MDEKDPAARAKSQRLIKAAIIAAAGVVVSLGLIFAVLAIHDREAASNVSEYLEPAPGASGYVDMHVKVADIDLEKETLSLWYQIIPRGDLADDEGGAATDLVFTYLSSGLKEEETLTAGDTGQYSYGELELTGNVADYPWDRHTTDFTLSVAKTDASGAQVPVPERFQVYAAWPGLDINFHPESYDRGSERHVDIAVVRSTVTTAIVVFSIVLTWILIATVVSMTVAVSAFGRTVAIEMFAFFGTLLFALTAFRDSMPGTPPMGTLSDYLSFFWGYAVAIIAIGVLAVFWLKRRPSGGKDAGD